MMEMSKLLTNNHLETQEYIRLKCPLWAWAYNNINYKEFLSNTCDMIEIEIFDEANEIYL